MNKQELKKLLETTPHSLDVQFIKTDGSVRVMECSLHPDLLPDGYVPSEGRAVKEYDHVLNVYDTEKKAWRAVNFSKGPVQLLNS